MLNYQEIRKIKGPAIEKIKKKRIMIGGKIRMFREKRGYSQDKLAQIMGVHRTTISKIETGKFSLSIDYLIKFALCLDFEVSLMDKYIEQ